MLIGAHLFACPLVFGTPGQAASSANAWIAGVCLVVLATLCVPDASGPHTAEIARAGVGAWLLASPFALDFAGSWAAWNAWVAGALAIYLADVPSIAFALVLLAASLHRARKRYRARRLTLQNIVRYGGAKEPASPGLICRHIVERSCQIRKTLRRNPSPVQAEACILGLAACMDDLTSLIGLIAERLPKSGPVRRRKLGLIRWAATCAIDRAAEAFPEALGLSRRGCSG
jgi:hypothetical protein